MRKITLGPPDIADQHTGNNIAADLVNMGTTTHILHEQGAGWRLAASG
jgi:hypothetical protein